MLTPLGLVLIGLGVVGLADLGPVRSSRPRGHGRLSGLRPATAVLGGLGLIALDIVLAIVLLVVLGGSSAGAQEIQVVGVDVRPVAADEQVEPLVVDDLDPEAVLMIRAAGFARNATGSLVQCATDDVRRCGNTQAVRFDDRGRAEVQYLVQQRFAVVGEPCSTGGLRCTIELDVRGETAVIETFFGATAPPPGSIEVRPDGPHQLGDEVTVVASGFPAGVEMTVTVCAQPSVRGSRCGAPAPMADVRTDAEGRASAVLDLDIEQVGEDGVACGRRTDCQVVVIAADATIRAAPAVLSIDAGVGAAYDATRVAVALVIAAGLVAVAAVLIRATDWDPPSEADSTTLDEAELADLDLEAELFGEEPVPL